MSEKPAIGVRILSKEPSSADIGRMGDSTELVDTKVSPETLASAHSFVELGIFESEAEVLDEGVRILEDKYRDHLGTPLPLLEEVWANRMRQLRRHEDSSSAHGLTEYYRSARQNMGIDAGPGSPAPDTSEFSLDVESFPPLGEEPLDKD